MGLTCARARGQELGGRKKTFRRRRWIVGHLAVSFKDDTFVHAEARGENIAPKNRRAVNFDPVLCPDGSVYFATNNNDPGFDLTTDPRSFANHERVGSKNLAPKTSAYSDRSLKAKLSLEFTTVIEDAAYLS